MQDAEDFEAEFGGVQRVAVGEDHVHGLDGLAVEGIPILVFRDGGVGGFKTDTGNLPGVECGGYGFGVEPGASGR